MRVTTAFNRVLALAGASVESVSFTDTGIVVGLRRRRRRWCCPCGAFTLARYDTSRRRWRHLDFGACRVWLEADVHRLDCRSCGRVRTEQVPWARASARHSADFEDVVAWLAQRMDKTSVARLMRCSWEAVDNIVTRVVAEYVDDSRLESLYRIGVDEISYKRGHNYLTIVGDHDTGRVVWVAEGRDQAALNGFYDALGVRRRQDIEAVTMDMGTIYRNATREAIPQATICFDPFHVIKWANEALDAVFRAAPALPPEKIKGVFTRRSWRRTRTTLRLAAEKLDDQGQQILKHLRRHQRHVFRAWQLKEELRELYRSVEPEYAEKYLKTWCAAAQRSRIGPIKTLAGRILRNFEGIVAAVQLGLSNSRLEGINAKIRLIQRRGYGYRDVDSLGSMIYLCLGGIDITLPTQR